MDDVIDYIASVTATIMVTILMWVFIGYGLLLILAAWLIISAGLAWIDHRRLLKEAQVVFDQVREKNMPRVQVDPLLHAIFGDVDLPPAGIKNTDDWLTETLFGVS